MSIPTNNLPTAEVVTDDDTIVGNDGGSTVGVTKQFAGTAFLRPEQIGEDVASQADVDAKVSKSGDTMNGPLTLSNWMRVSGTYPSIYLYDQDGTPDQRTFQMGSNNSVTVLRAIRDDNTVSNAFIQMYHDTGRLNLGVSTEVLVPANSGTGAVNQAARITARNPATGQLQIDGIECGWTGEVVSTELSSGWTGTIHYWRNGYMTTVTFFDLDGTNATGNEIFTLPAGFVDGRGSQGYDIGAGMSITAAANGVLSSSSRPTSRRGVMHIPTRSAWPAAL